MPNVELVRAIYIYYNMFKLIDSLISFVISCTQTDRQKERQTARQTDGMTNRQTHGHEYSIVAVDKPQL